MQNDLNDIYQWTKDWLLKLNVEKCNVLHIEKSNPNLSYILNGTPLKAVTSQQDLGVTISQDLKWEPHIAGIVKRANSITYLIKKAFLDLTPEMMLKIYKTYVRPLLEYAFQIWSPYFAKDIDLLEKVQRRFTKMPRALKDLRYEDRLKALKLTTLKARRERGDLIETFKIFSGHYNCPGIQEIFTTNTNVNLRGHSKKINKTSFVNRRKHFLANRVVEAWNKLPQHVIDASTTNQFKARLDSHMEGRNA